MENDNYRIDPATGKVFKTDVFGHEHQVDPAAVDLSKLPLHYAMYVVCSNCEYKDSVNFPRGRLMAQCPPQECAYCGCTGTLRITGPNAGKSFWYGYGAPTTDAAEAPPAAAQSEF